MSKNIGNLITNNIPSPTVNDIFANFQGNNKKNTSSLNEEYTFKKIPVVNIKLNPNNKNYNKNDTEADIEDLAARIDLEGLLSPLIVCQAGRNEYILLAGERRFKAISTILNWREVECKVYTRISEALKTFILNETNLGRALTDEQRFIGYQEIVNVLEGNNEYDKEKVARLCSLSKYKMRQFETIRQNAEQSDIFKLQSGEITFKDIKEIADAKKQINIANKKIDEASKIYAEAITNPSVKIYIDRKSKCLFSVGKKIDHLNETYSVRINNYDSAQSNMAFIWLKNGELPECSSQIEAQVHLDSYAINHNLEECSIEEFISKTQEKKKSSDSTSKTENTGANNEDDYVAPEKEKSYFPKIVSNTIDDEVSESQNNDINTPDTSVGNEKVSKQAENKLTENNDDCVEEDLSDNEEIVIDTENFAYTENLIRENNDSDIEAEATQEIEKYKNRYALSIVFVGREVKSKKIVKGFLTHDENTDKYFIVPVTKIGKDLSTDNESRNTIYGIGYEVERESVYTKTDKL